MESLVASSINLGLLIAFMVYKLREPIHNFVAERHHSISHEVESVREQLRKAQEQYDEFAGKLKAVDAEISVLREQMKQDAAAVKQRVVTEGKRMSGILVSDAKHAADTLFLELKGQLYNELTSRVLEKAEATLRERLTGDDRARIRQEFSRQVESVQ